MRRGSCSTARAKSRTSTGATTSTSRSTCTTPGSRSRPGCGCASTTATNGSLIYRGADAWNGIIDSASPGPCTQVFPIHGTSRTVAGAPFDEELYKCKTQPVEAAIDRGVYGWWQPTDAEIARLNEIFPSGVCDFSKGDQGRPPGFH